MLFHSKKQNPTIIAGRWAQPVHFYIMGYHFWTENNPCPPPVHQNDIMNDGGIFKVNGKRLGHNLMTSGERADLINFIKNN